MLLPVRRLILEASVKTLKIPKQSLELVKLVPL